MTERSYQDAVQILKDRMGGRWEGIEAQGRDEMVSILKQQLGYDDRAANDAIDAMIESGTLRYHRAVDRDDAVVPPVVPAAAGTAGGGPAAVPLATGAIGGGYWEIGPSVSEVSGVVGRAGQVEPR
ncbi:MAG TPA: hypothetical protein VKE41_05525 [Roseiflexaceae bacterium]|nr:hypothetical protein [Roseiflexaceae bacterium]